MRAVPQEKPKADIQVRLFNKRDTLSRNAALNLKRHLERCPASSKLLHDFFNRGGIRKIKFTRTGRKRKILHTAGKVIHSVSPLPKVLQVKKAYCISMQPTFCKGTANPVAGVLIHGKATVIHVERVSVPSASCLQLHCKLVSVNGIGAILLHIGIFHGAFAFPVECPCDDTVRPKAQLTMFQPVRPCCHRQRMSEALRQSGSVQEVFSFSLSFPFE